MKTRDPIEALSYFARKIDFAVGTETGIEEGESIQITGVRDIGILNAGCGLTGKTDPSAVLLQLEEEVILSGEIC